MPIIDFCKNKEAFAMIKTVLKKFAGATKREIEGTSLTRIVQ